MYGKELDTIKTVQPTEGAYSPETFPPIYLTSALTAISGVSK